MVMIFYVTALEKLACLLTFLLTGVEIKYKQILYLNYLNEACRGGAKR